MKILYGVQGTGNGHITRARAMDVALKKQGFTVDYLFSGRSRDKFFDMEQFGDFICCDGLTFITDSGRIKPLDTYNHNSFIQLRKDIKSLDLSAYDLILTDFEPITAWAARRQKKMCVAIGHQYAFDHKIPKRGSNPITSLFMKFFAPAEVRLGLHWHHFDQAILPPIADTKHNQEPVDDKKFLVYLGFEQAEAVIDYLKPFTDYQFYIYAPYDKAEDRGHIHLRPLSRQGFQDDLANCNGVITNAGFELASEAIHLGKKLLVKPLRGQMEQLSNAKALEELGLGKTMNKLDPKVLEDWLQNFVPKRVIYPDVPEVLAQWIAEGNWQNTQPMIKQLWQAVHSPDIANFAD